MFFTPEDAFIDEQNGATIHWIVPNAQKNVMEPVILELEPKASSRVIEPHDGEEMGYVLSGRIVLVRGAETKGNIVRKGETFYIKGDQAHRLENTTNKKAVVLWISTPPEF